MTYPVFKKESQLHTFIRKNKSPSKVKQAAESNACIVSFDKRGLSICYQKPVVSFSNLNLNAIDPSFFKLMDSYVNTKYRSKAVDVDVF
jgi:hypothetical protein